MYYDLRKLKSIFDRIAMTTSYTTAFADLLDHALLPFQYFPDGKQLQEGFLKWKAYKNLNLLNEFLTELANLTPEGFKDPLGEFYMQEISHGKFGQYFTPEHIVDLMVMLLYNDKAKEAENLLDPACGSGRFILGMAKYNRHMRFYGADLDATCCKMTLLNLLLNSLSGEVAHMDSLSNKFFKGYKVRTRIIDGYHYPYFIAFDDPKQSAIWLSPQKINKTPVYVQGDLFTDNG